MKLQAIHDAIDRGAAAEDIESNSGSRRGFIIGPEEKILVTGATGFIGAHVVKELMSLGFRNIVCFARNSQKAARVESGLKREGETAIEFINGNLLSRADCKAACEGSSIVIHLAAGTGEKSFPDAFINSVVTTRNLLDASLEYGDLKRFTLVSSFAVYSNRQNSRTLDETCPLEQQPERRGDAYCFAKVKQEQILRDYALQHPVPYTIVRPGAVYGPGRKEITGRVGLGTFGLFLHLGGSNKVPFTFVENCAQAIALAALVGGVNGEAFNVVDDDLLTSREFLRMYKKHVKNFRSVYVPHPVSRALCRMWESYSRKSNGQLPLAFSDSRWYVEWRSTRYTNQKLKTMLGWSQKVATPDGMRSFVSSAQEIQNA